MIPFTLLTDPRLLVAVGIAVAAAGGSWWLRGTMADAEVAKLQAAHAAVVAAADRAKTTAVEEALSQSRAAIDRAEEIVNAARAEEEKLRTARAAAVAESGRLQDAAVQYQRRRAAACVAGAAGGSASGALPDDVRDGGDRLLRVFGECVGAHGSLADDLGRSRARGLGCERWAAEVAKPTCEGAR